MKPNQTKPNLNINVLSSDVHYHIHEGIIKSYNFDPK